uniref:Uncharacterized protein n=1 Tax=Arundo donax TaxID=35708 RepID=A0A0A8YTC0_ARUDO
MDALGHMRHSQQISWWKTYLLVYMVEAVLPSILLLAARMDNSHKLKQKSDTALTPISYKNDETEH